MGRREALDAEANRLEEASRRERRWDRWGPYLSERQWGTVREDYSEDGAYWQHFPHQHARSRAYRWGEDGLLGICDHKGRLCFALALWNEKDPILKERLFGLSGLEGNHGADVKECYHYLDSTPTHSYLKALYKYPQVEFPYRRLVEENLRRGRDQPEFELAETGVFDEERYFDTYVEYAKESPNHILIRITLANRGAAESPVHVLPTLWFRNTWAWGRTSEGSGLRPSVSATEHGTLLARHADLGEVRLEAERRPGLSEPSLLFTENETNARRLFDAPNRAPFVKDAFHDLLIEGRAESVNPARIGTKAAFHWRLEVPAGGQVVLRLRLYAEAEPPLLSFGPAFDQLLQQRQEEADCFYASRLPPGLTEEERQVARQAYAGLLWSKQFYHYAVRPWLEGDPAQPAPPVRRRGGRNSDWPHLCNRDVVSVPDKWEYPFYSAWDLAFQTICLARVDPQLAKTQLLRLLREWYMHPNGQIPASEPDLSAVSPPVHAWACWRVYKMTGVRGRRDRSFLQRAFHKLLLSFTWWLSRRDPEGRSLFGGGYLGLDQVGVFDRSEPLPGGERVEPADGAAWTAFFCTTMLSIALELARQNADYEEVASKFLDHFVAVADVVEELGGTGLWNEARGGYTDQVWAAGQVLNPGVRSMAGLVPLCAAEILEPELLKALPGFWRRVRWFQETRGEFAQRMAFMETANGPDAPIQYLLALPSRSRLERVLERLLDQKEFLSPFGIRSMSRAQGQDAVEEIEPRWRVRYEPGESTSIQFGGNINWRGPIWFPLNYLLIEALERYHHVYEDTLLVECPTGSGLKMNLEQVAHELSRRLTRLFLPDADGLRPYLGGDRRTAERLHWKDLVLFHEYFDGDTGRGLGASHHTGWTALVIRCLEDVARHRLSQLSGDP
jgi:hypothetical protein